jgi:hypothetical protein
MPDIRVQDEQGNIHVFPDGSTPEAMAQAMGVKPPAPQQTLAQLVRAKYPGAYDDMKDTDLESAVLAKHPEYSDLPRTQAPGSQQQAPSWAGQATSIGPQKKGVLPWLQNVEGDIKSGSSNTLPGKVLSFMGAKGTDVGSQAGAPGEYMASPLLGTVRAAQGAARLPWQPWQGTKDIVGGALTAAQIPASFMGGPAAEAGASATAAASGKLFGNVERAANLFNTVKAAAPGEVEITGAMSQAAMRAQELANAGAKGMPRVISRFVARVTDPEKAPIAWDEARDFYSNVSRLSANEYQSMNPQMAGQVGKFAGAFDDALRATATAAGKGDEYAQAMQLYRTAKVWQKFGANVWQGAKSALPWAGGAAAGSYAARKVLDAFNTGH